LGRWAVPTGRRLPGGWGGSRSENKDRRFPAGAMAYSPDGSMIATSYGVDSGQRFDSHILLWDRATGSPRGELKAKFAHAHPTAIAFSPDGSVLAGIFGPTLQAFDVAAGRLVADIKPGTRHFKGFAF